MKRYRIFKNEWSYFIFRGIKLLDKSERWRRVARILKVSKEARLRLEWIIYYYDYDQGALNASKLLDALVLPERPFISGLESLMKIISILSTDYKINPKHQTKED